MPLRRLFVLIAFAQLTVMSACAQPVPGPRLIVRGDDMGFSHSGNEAMIKCYREGIETSIEVIVPSPWFPEAVRLLREHPGIDVGVHLALTSEWDNIKWRPVSNSPSITDENGYLYPFIWPNKSYPGRALLENAWQLADIERELRAQIEMAKKNIPRVSHYSAHMGCANMNDDVKALVNSLAAEYGIDIDPADYGVQPVGYEGPKETSEEKVASFIRMLEGLKAGETYLFVDHPGLNTPELQAIHHHGYDKVAVDRQGVTDAWTDPRVKEAVKRLRIQLISYADLKGK